MILVVSLTGAGIFGYETGDFPEAGDPATGESSIPLFLIPPEGIPTERRLFP